MGQIVNWVDGLFLIAISALWGTSYPVTKVALQGFEPFLLGTLRFASSSIVLLGFMLWKRRTVALPRTDVIPVALLALFQSALFVAGLNLAVSFIPAGQASVIVYIFPLLVAVAAYLFLGEPLGRVQVAGLIIGVVGVAVAGWEHFAGGLDLRGALFAIGAAVSWAIASILFKRFLLHVDLLTVTTWQSVFAAGWLLLLSLVMMEFSQPVNLTLPVVLATGWLGFFGVAVAHFLWFYVLTRTSAAAASSYIFLAPVFGVLFSYGLLGEQLTIRLIVSLACVAAGIYLVNRPPTTDVPTDTAAGKQALRV